MAIQRDISLIEYYGGSVVWNKITSQHSIPLIKAAKEKGLHVRATVSINNLCFNSTEHISLDSYKKVYPTLREESDRLALIEGLQSGIIDGVVSDHQPQDYEAKELEFEYAEYGIATQECVFPMLVEQLGQDQIPLILDVLSERNYAVLQLEKPELNAHNMCVISTQQEVRVTPKTKGINTPLHNNIYSAKAELV